MSRHSGESGYFGYSEPSRLVRLVDSAREFARMAREQPGRAAAAVVLGCVGVLGALGSAELAVVNTVTVLEGIRSNTMPASERPSPAVIASLLDDHGDTPGGVAGEIVQIGVAAEYDSSVAAANGIVTIGSAIMLGLGATGAGAAYSGMRRPEDR